MIDFQWSRKKARINIQKHKIDFNEAKTIFDDPEHMSKLDIDHSEFEDRFISLGLSARGRLLIVAHTFENDTIRIISARKATNRERNIMKKKSEVIKEYDFSKGIRGKYAKRYAAGTNLIVLSNDVVKIFPDSKSVNDALRMLARIAGRKTKKVA